MCGEILIYSHADVYEVALSLCVRGDSFNMVSLKAMVQKSSVFPDWVPDLQDIWFAELARVDSTSITVALIFKGFTLLIIGYFICRFLSRQIEKKLLSRLEIDIALKHTLGMVIFYFFLSILTLFILNLLNIPISVFTWIGGAFALGVGLGSQNIVNNFISGLVMMVERPVKVGDIVDVEGVAGTVEHIGARSTQVKSLDNTHIVVPNSSFLEKNVLNWTLSDDVVRTSITVGVAYGSPTRKVEELLKECVRDEEQVLLYPEPVALFTDFASSSLNFELLFWSHVQNVLQLKKLESAIRYNIDDKFKESDIVIAFPQLDIHLNHLNHLNGTKSDTITP